MLEVIRAAASADPDIGALWTLNHPNVNALLAGERGWSPERYESWLGDLLISRLLHDGGR